MFACIARVAHFTPPGTVAHHRQAVHNVVLHLSVQPRETLPRRQRPELGCFADTIESLHKELLLCGEDADSFKECGYHTLQIRQRGVDAPLGRGTGHVEGKGTTALSPKGREGPRYKYTPQIYQLRRDVTSPTGTSICSHFAAPPLLHLKLKDDPVKLGLVGGNEARSVLRPMFPNVPFDLLHRDLLSFRLLELL